MFKLQKKPVFANSLQKGTYDIETETFQTVITSYQIHIMQIFYKNFENEMIIKRKIQ